MLKREIRRGAMLNGNPHGARRVAGFGLAYLLFFASIFSAAHSGHAKGLSFDPLHAIVCAVDNEKDSTPLRPPPQGPDNDLSCCVMGFAPNAVLAPSGLAFIAPTNFEVVSKILPIFETQEGFPLSAKGTPRAPPFVA